jgi:hypothetical protein
MHAPRTPTGFGENSLSWKEKISSLKSYDYSNLIRFMLPIAIRGFVTKRVHQVVFKLVRLFRCVCSKNVDGGDLDLMRTELAIMMSLLEMQLPTFFFITKSISSLT